MLVLLQPQERARQPHPRRGKHNCNVPMSLPRSDGWQMEEREVGACSKFLPAKRQMQKYLQGKYEILDNLLWLLGNK